MLIHFYILINNSNFVFSVLFINTKIFRIFVLIVFLTIINFLITFNAVNVNLFLIFFKELINHKV